MSGVRAFAHESAAIFAAGRLPHHGARRHDKHLRRLDRKVHGN